MSLIEKVHMVILMEQNKDFEKCIEFYKKIGFKLKFHLKDKWAEFVSGDLIIGICPTDQELPERRTGIVMKVEDLKNKYEEFKDEITFLEKPFEAIHGIMVSVKDPGGNIFDLYQPTPEKVKDFAKKTAQENCCQEESCGYK